MDWLNTERRYGRVSVTLHWCMVVLLVAIYACMELHGYFPKGSAMRTGMKTWHFMLGLCVPMLVLMRLGARASGRRPVITPLPPAWQRHLASAMHLVLYLFMIGMPIAGWLTLSAAGKPIPFFGLELPALVAPNKALARQIKEIHELGANLGYGLIALHACAALFHHYIVRDNTLERMLPGSSKGIRTPITHGTKS